LEEVSQEKLQNLYGAASAFIFPSLYEGFGLPPLEAMASGCPVIASNAASIPEVCGEAALYFDPQSVQQLAEQMGKIVREKNLQRQLIRKGLEQSTHFSWESAAKLYRTLFLSLKK
jgi:Glycosyltransferase